MSVLVRSNATPEVEDLADLEATVADQGRAKILVPKEDVGQVLGEIKVLLSGLGVRVRTGKETADGRKAITVVLGEEN